MFSTTSWREISSKGGIMKMRDELSMPDFYGLHALCKTISCSNEWALGKK